MARFITLTVAAVAIASCGGGSDDTAATTVPATDAPVATTAESAPPAETAPPTTAPPETAPPTTTPVGTAPAATEATDTPAAAGTVAVSLAEWEVVAPTTIPAGPTTFAVTNDGDFRHHFGVARGDSYDDLPQLPSGAIDEAALGDDYLGRTENIDFGGSDTIEFDLTPGNYVFFCNIIAGPTSHAAQGQVLSVTVS